MPRFLGQDYYNDDFIARRDLSARASLTVPRRFEEDCENNQAVTYSDVYGTYQADLDHVRPFEVFDDDTSYSLEASDEILSGVEQLHWAIKWKEFDGNYIEIVPSSNPESESSIFDSQPESVSEAFVVEEFKAVPLQWTLEDKGYLEEPTHVVQSELLTTRLPNLMKWSTQGLGSQLEDLSPAGHQDGENVTEDGLFSKTDLHLEVSAELDSEVPPVSSSSLGEIFSKTETFEQHRFIPAKAEELMYPVTDDDSASSSRQQSHSPHRLVHKAFVTCTEQGNLQAFPTLLASAHLEIDADLWSLNEMAKIQQPKEEGPEKLLMSPQTVECASSFLLLNEHGAEQEEAMKRTPNTSVLESPVNLLTSSSPLLYDDNMAEAFLEPWSPDSLADHSPLLNKEGVNKLEVRLRYGEACFGNIKAFKFLEPQLDNHEQEAKNPEPVAEAVRLASSADCRTTLAQLELNLSWDLTHPKAYHRSHFCPEPFNLAPTEHAQPQTWKLCLEFEAVEALVERELDKKSAHHRQKEVDEDESFSLSDHLKDGMRSQRKISLNENHTGAITSEESVKTKDVSVDVSAKSSKFLSKLPYDVTNSNTLSSISPLQSITSPYGRKLRNESHVLQKDLTYKTQETTQKTVLTPNSKSSDFPCKRTHQENKLAILETPNVATKRQNGKETTENWLPSYVHITSTDGDEDLTYHGHQPTKDVSDPSHDEGPESENTVLSGFDLQFDEEDLDSDTFDDLTSPDTKSKPSASSAVSCEAIAFDPVDNFLMMRAVRVLGSKTQDLVKGHSVVKPIEKTQQASGKAHHPGVITPMSVLPRSVGASEQRFLTVSLSGPYLSALQETCSQAAPHMERLRAQGIVTADSTFLGLKPDYTRFLLKNRMTRLEDGAGDDASRAEDSKDEVYKCVAVVHTLRLAAQLLVHYCLESAIVHLGAMQDKYHVLTGALEGLRKALFQCQFNAQQSRQLHPKVAAICREIQQHHQACPAPRKMLVVIRREEPTLVKTLQSAIGLDGTVAHVMNTQGGHHSWPSDCQCVLTWNQGVAVALVPKCTLVLEFEADPLSSLHNACQTENVHYVGLSVQETQTIVTETRMLSVDKGVTVIGSQHLIQYQQLLQLLETRHNIIVVRRDYASLGHVHYPDVVVNVHKGAVLVPLSQLREEGGLERVTERLAAVGLQLATVWILLHGMEDCSSSRNLVDKNAVKKMVQLQALMSNLSTSTKEFVTHYKVLLCKTAADVALYLSHLTTLSSHTPRPDSDNTLIAEDCPLPPVEMSKEEEFLLGIPCLNPFSCQLLLSRASVGKILTMTLNQLRSVVPELPESCLQNLHRVVNMDRGLHLRPYVTDSASQMYDHTSQSGHHPLPDSTSLHHGQSEEEKADLAMPPDSQTFLLDSDVCQRQTRPPTSHYQHTERSDCVSPEVTLPNVPLSLSKSLHYTEQPTPLLQPVQKESENADISQTKILYKRGAASYTERDPFDPRFSSLMYKRQEFEQPFQPGLEGKNRQSFHLNHPEYFQEKMRNQTNHENENSHGSQEYTLVDYHSTRNSLGYPASSVVEFSRDQQQELSNRVLSSSWGERKTFSHSELGSNHPSGQVKSSAMIVSPPRLNVSQFSSPRSLNSVKPVCTSVEISQESRFPDQPRIFDVISLAHPVGRSADLGNSARNQVLSPQPKYLKTNMMHDPVCGSFDFVSSRSFEGIPSSRAEAKATMSGSRPVDYNSTHSTWNDDHNFWPMVPSAHGRFIDEHGLQPKKAETNHNQTFLPRSETLPLEYPISPSWQASADISMTWKPHKYSVESGYLQADSHTLSAEESCRVEFLRPQTTLAKEQVYIRDSSNIPEPGNMPTYSSAHFRQLAPDYQTSSRSDNYQGPVTEPLDACYEDEDARQSSALPPRTQPSFCEDLAATTRRLLQGKSSGLMLSAGHYYKPRTPVHRISVGLAQPLRREEANVQESGKAQRVQMTQPLSPDKAFCQQSPPLDMDWEFSAPKGSHHISDTKLKKWSANLQYKKKLECDSRSSALSGEELWPSAGKKRATEKGQKLTYQAVPGAGGQTRLAFL